MGAQSKIEWTDASWNPIRARRLFAEGDVIVWGRSSTKQHGLGWHCEHISEGCRNCYAETMNRRLGTGLDFKPGHLDDIEIFLDEKMLLAPFHWRKPRRIFVCSMTDLFGAWVKYEWLDRIFAVMALCPQHTFQVLTKRPKQMRGYLSIGRANPVGLEALGIVMSEARINPRSDVGAGVMLQGDIPHLKVWPLPNVWLGVSCEDQATYDRRKDDLRATPAAIHFFSIEPMLGPINADLLADWVICGGESGHGARPMHPDWARSLRNQCAAAGVPFFLKQWGEYLPRGTPPEIGSGYDRVGKKRAGHLLDGREHNEFPT